MCNLYSFRSSKDEIRKLTRAAGELLDMVGNFEPIPAIFPDRMAPVVRHLPNGDRELTMMRWGWPPRLPRPGEKSSTRPITNIRNTASRFWTPWLKKIEHRCLVPVTAFCEPDNGKGPNPHCIPPWSRDELGTKAARANLYAQNEAGCRAIAPLEDRIPKAALDKLLEASREQAKLDGPVLFSELLNRRVEPVQELIAGLVERGVATFFAGPGGSNKSRLGVQAQLSVDAGVPFIGHAVQKATSLYVSTEDHQDEVARRVQKITQRLKLPADGGVAAKTPTKPDPGFVARGLKNKVDLAASALNLLLGHPSSQSLNS